MERQTESLALSDKAQVAINSLSERLNIDSETLMVALWAGFMARVMRTDSLSFSWHADVRTEELQGAFGCFTMILPVTLEFKSEMPTEAILRSTTSQLQSAALWQECFDAGTYADHLANLGASRHGIEFAYIRVLQLPAGWAFRHIEIESGDSRLQCLCFDEGGQRVLRWQGVAKYLPGTLQTWMCQFVALLESVGRCLEQPWMNQPMLGHAEREKILRAARASRFECKEADHNPCTLHGLFEEQVKRMPEKLAVVCGNERLTYRDLNNRANTMARRLRHHGVEIEQCVGICLGRSVDMIGAMLAVLKCGAAYVPLDPSYPEERINDMLAGADISVVIATTIDQERFSGSGIRYVSIEESSEDIGEDLPEEKVAPDHLAYAVYTSGSTGKPKGVMVSHANAVASTLARFRFYRTPVERFLLLSSSSFDSSVAGIYWTLGQGGTLYLPIEGMHYDPTYITELISRESISHLLALPSLYKQILNDIEDAAGFKCAIVAGEVCHSDVVDLHKRKLPAVELVNEYGPAEGTVWSNAYRIEHGCVNDMRVPIGQTIDSAYGYVFDDRLELCPVGMPGEWYIGGDGVVRGYVGRPALTAHRFVADPFGSGERLYRTGDRVRVRPDGELEYLGRVDNQVKLRGYRIELDEIEGVLRSHQGVREAVVIVHGGDQLNQQLVGFFATAEESSDIKHQALREELLEYLRRALPAFMVPTLIISVASLPLMPNGKVDRPALIALIDQGARAPYVPPADDTERALAQIWQSVLKVERVGVKDNFFDLGGHSLLATQVTSRIRQMLAVDLPLKDLFEAKTLGELAVQVRDLIDASRDEFSAMESIIAGNEQ
jgi:amino acid adenylation domain-containing protein